MQTPLTSTHMSRSVFLFFCGTLGLCPQATEFMWNLLVDETGMVPAFEARKMEGNAAFATKIQMLFPTTSVTR